MLFAFQALSRRNPESASSALDTRLEDLRTDEGLMTAYRQGDAGAFDILYARHRAAAYRYILHHCRHRDSADTLFQEVWLAAWAALPGAA